jgi:hypothetical protein
MLEKNNAYKTILVIVAGVVAIIGWFVLASTIFGDGPTKIASEIARNFEASRVERVAINTPVPLIPEVSLTITNIQWSSSLIYRPAGNGVGAGTTSPSNSDHRFLVVDYEISNGSDNFLARDNLGALLHVTGSDDFTINAVDIEILRIDESFTYGSSPSVKLLKIPPNLTYQGSWFFELDPQTPRLLLTSSLIGFEIVLLEDIHGPLSN